MGLFTNESLKGHHALVTGATGGIGYETALLLTSMGASITITGRRKERLKQLEKQILEQNPEAVVLSISADISIEEDRDSLISKAEKEIGDVDLLVNSAGSLGGDIVEELPQAELEQIMHINYTVPILLSQQVFKKMKRNKRGAIVNVSSLSGLRGTFGGTAYCGSKFALIGFTQAFALEAIEHDVRVNAVCPGYVETDMGQNAIRSKAKRENRSFEEQYELANKGLPSGRITKPEEVANTIAFLLTDAASNIVGESVKISGGAVMR
ncbi:SDR family NAD(P)-dependent oxidoreductase [Aquibacillus rhizosphaerae]|uniref:SDR family oxidoreductase n=1 Tax=Aquibacillus rhizosphaerae TaxID=3051431 RepID=A0ABT7L7F3_9BACI|nr:SDR family oxidoreductase [Aquibacillus sp. LR5S19]MDL4841147.1 SDR family oxidoreductase [Aquibacillus sp. LR5S19]